MGGGSPPSRKMGGVGGKTKTRLVGANQITSAEMTIWTVQSFHGVGEQLLESLHLQVGTPFAWDTTHLSMIDSPLCT